MNKIKIVITGAESTGKSTLCAKLAEHYNTIWLPEFAREYVETLDRPYTYDDVVAIAKKQIILEEEYFKKVDKILFVDTSLIITKVWFEIVYKKKPDWLAKKINTSKANFYLLCNNDVEWQQDTVRENGGEMRDKLFKIYHNELIELGIDYKIVEGQDNIRTNNAIQNIDNFLKQYNFKKTTSKIF